MIQKVQGNKSATMALLGNIFVTVIKTIVAISSGSTSMFAESVHSFADTLNQSLLLIGLRRSRKPADESRGYGYGIERFFWSLISACGVLFVGAGVTVIHSVDTLLHPINLQIYDLNFNNILVLIIAFFVEGLTLWIALKELKGKEKFSRKLLSDADPVTLAVVYEDGTAVIGVLVALSSQLLVYFTQNNIYDSIGGIIIGLLLGFLAILLIKKNHGYIIGKPLDEEVIEEITEFLRADPCIESISEFKSVAVDFKKYRIYVAVEWNGSPLYGEIYEAGDLKEEFDIIKKDFKEFTKLIFKTTDRIPRLVGSHINKIEKGVIKKFPQIAYVDIEIN